MMLNKKTYATITTENVDALFALPEKVLQFGTGVLLRGLPDYFIDKANKQGLFNGRVVVVKSTDQGGADAYGVQDGLYTILEKGIENGTPIERTTINASISRVVSAKSEWDEVLKCAASKDMQVIISNTTEVGITLVPSDATAFFPASFPGKLLHFLMERYRVFGGSEDAGMVIIPTELISDNGIKLKEIVFALTGKVNAIIKAHKTDTQPLFGCGSDFEERYWMALLRQVLVDGLLSKDIETYGIVKITDSGLDFIENPKSFRKVMGKGKARYMDKVSKLL